MKKIEISVRNETGLHSRPADLFVRTSKLYKADITVSKGDSSADAKAILQVILLNVQWNETVTIAADGEDEEEALKDLKRLIESDFKEIHDAVKI